MFLPFSEDWGRYAPVTAASPSTGRPSRDGHRASLTFSDVFCHIAVQRSIGGLIVETRFYLFPKIGVATAACLVQTRQKKFCLNFSIRDWLCNGFHLFVSSHSRPSELGTSLRTVDMDGER